MTQLLLEWVVTASLLILAVLALRALLGKRISAGLKYTLWAVVLIRLLVPLQFFSLPVPAFAPELEREPAVPAVSAVPDATFPALQGEPVGTPAITAPAPSGVAANYNAPMEPDAVTLDVVQVGTVLGWLWLAGALVMTAALLISNLTFALRLRRVRTPLEGADCPLPVYIAGGLPSPCLFGLFRPAVYVTAETAQDPAMLRHILAHEYTHFRHGDHVWNVLRSAALAVHWWNLLVWLAVVLSRRDCELACDEGALKRLGEVERIAYGRTLLALITVKSRPGDLLRCATTMTGGQKSVFDRVTRIAKTPKRWLWAAVAAVVAASLACVCAFGQAEGTPDPDPWDPSSVTADLTFSLETDNDGVPYVRMDGTVDGVELTRGAFWDPETVWREDASSELSMVYPAFTDGIEAHVSAWWTDEERTSVTLSTQMTAMLSSLFNVGYWEFTVELDSGAVARMEGLSFRDGLPDGETRFYPESISEEEALRAARIAAKLLTAGEDYYNNYTADVPYLYEVLDGASFYSVHAGKSLTFDAIAEALDPSSYSYVITQYASVDLDGDGAQELVLYVKQQGEFYLIFHEIDGELYSYLCGTKAMPLIKRDGTVWDNYVYPPEGDGQGVGYSKVSFSKTGIELHPFTYEVNLPSMEDGTGGNYRLVVDGQPADNQTYTAAKAALDAKPGAIWHQFPRAASGDLYAAMPELYADVFRGTAKFVLYKNEPPISIAEVPALICPGDEYMCFQRYAVVDLLGGQGSNEMPQVLVYVGGVAGDMSGYLLLWDEDGQVHGEIFDSYGWRNRWFIDFKTDGTFMCTDPLGGHDWMSISRLRPTAAGAWSLYSDAVWRGLDASGQKIDLESFMVIDQELDEAGFEQAMEAQRAKPDVTWHKLTLKDLDDVPAQPAFPVIDPGAYTFTMDEYGVNLGITGLDCESAYWYSKTNCSTPISGTAVGELSVSKPRFLGGEFTDTYRDVTAQYSPEGGGKVWMDVSENISGDLGSRQFLVDLITGAVTEQEINLPEWRGKLPVPPDKVLADAALTLAQLIQGAEDFYQSALPAPEEGPLPFDVPMKLMFCSGAGAWDTLLTLHPDGSFEGDFHDADMTIEYVCQFHGRFGDIRQVTDASWSLTLEELTLDTKYPVGAEWDEGVIHYISSTPYGFDKKGGEGTLEPGAQFMFYTPEAEGYRPTDELYGMEQSDDYESVMYQFWSWWPDKHVWGPYAGPLGCYGLCNMATGQGFFDLKAWGIA